jgi:hypothetical protein
VPDPGSSASWPVLPPQPLSPSADRCGRKAESGRSSVVGDLAGPRNVSPARGNESRHNAMPGVGVKRESGVFELIHEAGQLVDGARAWFLAQPLALRVLVGAGLLAVVWVAWILLRVLLVALRAAFRGL